MASSTSGRNFGRVNHKHSFYISYTYIRTSNLDEKPVSKWVFAEKPVTCNTQVRSLSGLRSLCLIKSVTGNNPDRVSTEKTNPVSQEKPDPAFLRKPDPEYNFNIF